MLRLPSARPGAAGGGLGVGGRAAAGGGGGPPGRASDRTRRLKAKLHALD